MIFFLEMMINSMHDFNTIAQVTFNDIITVNGGKEVICTVEKFYKI